MLMYDDDDEIANEVIHVSVPTTSPEVLLPPDVLYVIEFVFVELEELTAPTYPVLVIFPPAL